MEKKLYAKVIEDNGGGLSIYVMDENEKCIYAHSGYEYNSEPGRLVDDLKSLADSDSVSDWEGSEEELVAGWKDLDIDGIGREVVADLSNGKLSLYPAVMGAAAMREFGVNFQG